FLLFLSFSFFFCDTAPSEIYTLSLHDALPISFDTILSFTISPLDPKVIWVGTDDGLVQVTRDGGAHWTNVAANIKGLPEWGRLQDRKSTRLNSSHVAISYAVFCLKKKKKKKSK